MARFLIFAEGLPKSIERQTLVKHVASEDCHATRGYSIATSNLSTEELATQLVQVANRLGAEEGSFRLIVVRFDQAATHGFPRTEDCF